MVAWGVDIRSSFPFLDSLLPPPGALECPVESLVRSGPALGITGRCSFRSLDVDSSRNAACGRRLSVASDMMRRCIGSRDSNQMPYTSPCMGQSRRARGVMGFHLIHLLLLFPFLERGCIHNSALRSPAASLLSSSAAFGRSLAHTHTHIHTHRHAQTHRHTFTLLHPPSPSEAIEGCWAHIIPSWRLAGILISLLSSRLTIRSSFHSR